MQALRKIVEKSLIRQRAEEWILPLLTAQYSQDILGFRV